MAGMLPMSSINDDGNSTSGSPYAGPFTGPDTFQESGLTFLDVTQKIELKDAVAFLQNSSSAPAQQHAYLISKGNVQNVVAVLYSNQLNPSNNQRVIPSKVFFNAGDRVFIRAVQMSEAATAAAEKTTLVLKWEPA